MVEIKDFRADDRSIGPLHGFGFAETLFATWAVMCARIVEK